MTRERARRAENRRFITVIVTTLVFFIGVCVTAYAVINNDINAAEQEIQQRINSTF